MDVARVVRPRPGAMMRVEAWDAANDSGCGE